jgi:hypothetical protein
MLGFLKGTSDHPLTLFAKGPCIMKWKVNASFDDRIHKCFMSQELVKPGAGLAQNEFFASSLQTILNISISSLQIEKGRKYLGRKQAYHGKDDRLSSGFHPDLR